MARLTHSFRSLLIASALCAAATQAHAAASILIDVQTGVVLAEDNANQRWFPASLTKLMTAYIALSAVRDGKLAIDGPITISANAAKQPPSKMGYKPGNRLSLDNALKIMLVKSANDIAVAVGEAAGGVDYPKAMNAAAAKLGMASSNFTNANGLHSPQNYTTARDLAVLTRALRSEFPQYASYFGIEAIKYGDTLERNYNILLGRFAGADGMKTGFVCASGFNVVGTATRDGRTLAAIVLGEDSQVARAEKAANLLASGFDKPVSGPTLDDLKPQPGEARPAKDMRAEVCTEAAAADRWDGREIDGRVTFSTPYIGKMERDPKFELVGLLPTKSADGWPLVVPVPKARPAYAPAKAATPLEGAALRPAIPAAPKNKTN
ncbi:MAG: D-alanyl-D-alanine carboxypeptidase family protein [Rhizobiaceae bacterium]